MKRSYMDIRIDVTALNERERSSLAGHVIAQTEGLSEGDEYDYPDVDFEVEWVEVDDGQPREMLMHLNVRVPAGDDRDAGQIAEALSAALDVGSDSDEVRDLHAVIVLAEDIGPIFEDLNPGAPMIVGPDHPSHPVQETLRKRDLR